MGVRCPSHVLFAILSTLCFRLSLQAKPVAPPILEEHGCSTETFTTFEVEEKEMLVQYVRLMIHVMGDRLAYSTLHSSYDLRTYEMELGGFVGNIKCNEDLGPFYQFQCFVCLTYIGGAMLDIYCPNHKGGLGIGEHYYCTIQYMFRESPPPPPPSNSCPTSQS